MVLKMRKMKDSGIEWIGMIPEGWEVCRLKNIVACHDELRKPISADKRENHLKLYDYYGASGVIDTIDDYNVDGTVLLIGEDGANLKLRNLPLIYRASGKFWVNNHAHILIVNKKYSYDYVAYLLEAGDYSNYITGSAQPKLSQFNLMRFPVAIPNYTEQENISFFIHRECSKIDSILSETRSSIEEYKKLKQAVITQAVTKGVRGEREMKDSGVEWIGEIPKEWGRTKIKMIASFFNGDRTSRYPQPTDFVDDGIAFLTSRNIDGDEVDLSETKYITKSKYNSLSGAKIQIDDIIFCLRGSVGKCAINRTLSCGTVASSLATIRPKDIHPKYLLYFLLSNVASIQTAVFMNGTCAANLSAENVANYYITLPRSTEQKEIADYLDAKCAEIDGLIAKKEQLVKELESYKKSLIYEVVTGKREV